MLRHKGFEVTVHMKDEIDELQQDVHGLIILAKVVQPDPLKCPCDLSQQPGERAPPHSRTPR